MISVVELAERHSAFPRRDRAIRALDLYENFSTDPSTTSAAGLTELFTSDSSSANPVVRVSPSLSSRPLPPVLSSSSPVPTPTPHPDAPSQTTFDPARSEVVTLYSRYSVTVLLDVRPSMASLDPRHDRVFVDQLYDAVVETLRGLSRPVTLCVPGQTMSFAPEVFVHVAAVGDVEDNLEVLCQGVRLSCSEGAGEVSGEWLESLRRRLARTEHKLARMRDDPSYASRRTHRELGTFLRTALFTQKAFTPDSCPALVYITDGVFSPVEPPAYDSVLARLNRSDTPLVVVKVGPDAPLLDSVVGYIPEVDALKFLCRATCGAMFSHAGLGAACEVNTRSAISCSELQRVVMLRKALCCSTEEWLGSAVIRPAPTRPEEISDLCSYEMAESAEPVALVRSQLSEYTRSWVPVTSLVEARISEGFVVSGLSRTGGGVQVTMALGWMQDIIIEYVAGPGASQQTQDGTSYVPYVGVVINVLAPFYLLHQLSTIIERPDSFGREQTVVLRQLKAMVRKIEETDRVAMNLAFPFSQKTPSERKFWRAVDDVSSRVLHVCMKSDRLFFTATPSPPKRTRRSSVIPAVIEYCAEKWAGLTHHATARFLTSVTDTPPQLPARFRFARFLDDDLGQQAAQPACQSANSCSSCQVRPSTALRSFCLIDAIWAHTGVVELRFAIVGVSAAKFCEAVNLFQQEVTYNSVAMPIQSSNLRNVLVGYKSIPPQLSEHAQQGQVQRDQVAAFPLVPSPIPTNPLLFSFMYHRRWVWTNPASTSSSHILSLIVRKRLQEGLRLVNSGVFVFYKRVVLSPTFGNEPGNRAAVPEPLGTIIQYAAYLCPPNTVVTELWMEPQEGNLILRAFPQAQQHESPPLPSAPQQQLGHMDLFSALCDWFYFHDSHTIAACNTFDTLVSAVSGSAGTTVDFAQSPALRGAQQAIVNEGLHAILNLQPPFNIMSIISREPTTRVSLPRLEQPTPSSSVSQSNAALYEALRGVIVALNKCVIPMSGRSDIPEHLRVATCVARPGPSGSVLLTLLHPYHAEEVHFHASLFHVSSLRLSEVSFLSGHEIQAKLSGLLESAVKPDSASASILPPAEDPVEISSSEEDAGRWFDAYLNDVQREYSHEFARGLYSNLRQHVGCSLRDLEGVLGKCGEHEDRINITFFVSTLCKYATEQRLLQLSAKLDERLASMYASVSDTAHFFLNEESVLGVSLASSAEPGKTFPFFLRLYCAMEETKEGTYAPLKSSTAVVEDHQHSQLVELNTLGSLLHATALKKDWTKWGIELVFKHYVLPQTPQRIVDAARKALRRLVKHTVAEELLFHLRRERTISGSLFASVKSLLLHRVRKDVKESLVSLVFVDQREGLTLLCRELRKSPRLHWVSESSCLLVWPASADLPVRHWLLLEIEAANVRILFYSVSADATDSAASCREVDCEVLVAEMIAAAQKRVNQLMLLRSLSESRLCPSALVPKDSNETRGTPVGDGRFTAGQFECPLVHVMELHFHDRLLPLKPAELLANNAKALLSMQVSDRRLMFVCSTTKPQGNIYYMRLQESLYQKKSRASAVDLPPPTSEANCLVLCVYGVDPIVSEIEVDLHEVLVKKLEDLTLGVLAESLALNSTLRLTPQDIAFVQPPASPPSRIAVVLLPAGVGRSPFLPIFNQRLLRFLKSLRQVEPPSGASAQNSLCAQCLQFSDIVVPTKESPVHGLSFIYVSIVGGVPVSEPQMDRDGKPLQAQTKFLVPEPAEKMTDRAAVYEALASRVWGNKVTGTISDAGLPTCGDMFLVVRIWSRGASDPEGLCRRIAEAEVLRTLVDCCMEHFLRTVSIFDLQEWMHTFVTLIQTPTGVGAVEAPQEPLAVSRLKSRQGPNLGVASSVISKTFSDLNIPSWAMQNFCFSLSALINKVLATLTPPASLFFAGAKDQTLISVVTSPDDFNSRISMLSKDKYCYVILTGRSLLRTTESHHPQPQPAEEEEWLQFPCVSTSGSPPIPRNCCVVAVLSSQKLSLFAYNLGSSRMQQLEEAISGLFRSFQFRQGVLDAILLQKLGLFHLCPDYKSVDVLESAAPELFVTPSSSQGSKPHSPSQSPSPVTPPGLRLNSPVPDSPGSQSPMKAPPSGAAIQRMRAVSTTGVSPPFMLFKDAFTRPETSESLAKARSPVERHFNQLRQLASQYFRRRQIPVLCCSIIHPAPGEAGQGRMAEKLERISPSMRLVHWCRAPCLITSDFGFRIPDIKKLESSLHFSRDGPPPTAALQAVLLSSQANASSASLSAATSERFENQKRRREKLFAAYRLYLERVVTLSFCRPHQGGATLPPKGPVIPRKTVRTSTLTSTEAIAITGAAASLNSPSLSATDPRKQSTGSLETGLPPDGANSVPQPASAMAAKRRTNTKKTRALFYKVINGSIVSVKVGFDDVFVCVDVLSYDSSTRNRVCAACIQQDVSQRNQSLDFSQKVSELVALCHLKSFVHDWTVRTLYRYLSPAGDDDCLAVDGDLLSPGSSSAPAQAASPLFSPEDFVTCLLRVACSAGTTYFKEPSQYSRNGVSLLTFPIPLSGNVATPLPVFDRFYDNFAKPFGFLPIPSLAPSVFLRLSPSDVAEAVSNSHTKLSVHRGIEYCAVVFVQSAQPSPECVMVTVCALRVSTLKTAPHKRGVAGRKEREAKLLSCALDWAVQRLKTAVEHAQDAMLRDKLWADLVATDSPRCLGIDGGQFKKLIESCRRTPVLSLDEEGLSEALPAAPRSTILSSVLPWRKILDWLLEKHPRHARRLDDGSEHHFALLCPRDSEMLLHLVWDDQTKVTLIEICRRGCGAQTTSSATEEDICNRQHVTTFVQSVLHCLFSSLAVK